MTHPRLSKIDTAAARREITQSKEVLEGLIGRPVESFCYPSGDYTPLHEEITKEAGFKSGRTVSRFETSIGNDPFTIPTTVHAYRHWSDARAILRATGFRNFMKCYLNWDELAITLFDKTLADGGVFHLWGHSREIDVYHDWDRLERVFRHIADRPNVQYLTNAELLTNTEPSEQTVAIVAPYFPPHGGGLERYAYEIMSLLKKDFNWRVVVITSGEQNGKDMKEELDGLTIYRLSYHHKLSNTPFSFSWFRKIKHIMAAESPDLLNIHMPVPGIGDVAALVARKKPTVITYHAGSMIKQDAPFHNVLIWLYEHGPLQILLCHADRIICSSNFVRLGFLRRYTYKSTTITPAVDSEIFHPDPARKTENPTIVFAAGLGHAEQHKGLRTLIDAMKILQKTLPNVRLVVVGDGDMKNKYEAQARELKLENEVTFLGRLSGKSLVEAYQQGNVFVLPSSNESFSMVILEAMACGLTVASTDYPVRVFTSDVDADGAPHKEYGTHYSLERLHALEFAHTPFMWLLPLKLMFLPRGAIFHVHIAQAVMPEVALVAAKLRGFRYVMHFHMEGGPSGSLGSLFVLYKRMFRGLTLRAADKVIVLAPEQVEFLQTRYGVKKERITIIPNGVSEEFFYRKQRSLPKDQLKLLFVGRLCVQKRPERLMEMMKLLKIPAQLTIVGDGEDREKLETLTKDLNLKNVTFEGKKYGEQLQEYYNNADVFVIDSYQQGIPLVVLTPLPPRLPIIGPDTDPLHA